MACAAAAWMIDIRLLGDEAQAGRAGRSPTIDVGRSDGGGVFCSLESCLALPMAMALKFGSLLATVSVRGDAVDAGRKVMGEFRPVTGESAGGGRDGGGSPCGGSSKGGKGCSFCVGSGMADLRRPNPYEDSIR